MKNTLIVGHRGAGKSSLLKRLKFYFKNFSHYHFFDLDEVIEGKEQKSITAIFETMGETHFRNLEVQHLLALLNEDASKSVRSTLIVSLGAGFPLLKLPREILDSFSILWLRRESDDQGRIFFNRPRLDKSTDPLNEYQVRFLERNEVFKSLATEVWTVPEGLDDPHEVESLYFSGASQLKLKMGGSLTIYPHHLRSLDRLIQCLSWGLHRFELRDDLLTKEQFDLVLNSQLNNEVLISVRKNPKWIEAYLKNYPFDWPLELGPPRDTSPTILSSHQSQDFHDLNEFFAQITRSSQEVSGSTLLKASPLIKSFRDLQLGHAWHLSDPQRNIFLPRSEDGRWQWYRLWMGNRLKINFLRFDEGSSLDQPTLFEWLSRNRDPSNLNELQPSCDRDLHFAAVIGSPVRFSRSCMEHQDFFADLGLSGIFRIPISLEEWNFETLNWLHSLGLRYAAITSPLKMATAKLVPQKTAIVDELQSVNTLMWREDQACWIGHNTDIEGLRSLFSETDLIAPIVIWGGGGTLAAIKKLLPSATSYSARTGQPRSGDREISDPTTLIWAAGEDHQKIPEHWAPRKVLDLSYHDQSIARAYAMKWSANYVGGISMFKTQARQQRIFWGKHGS